MSDHVYDKLTIIQEVLGTTNEDITNKNKEVKAVKKADLEEYGLYPEDCKGGNAFCIHCTSRNGQLLTGFIKDVFMYKMTCPDCGFDALYYKYLTQCEPHNRWVRRAEAERDARYELNQARALRPKELLLRMYHGNTQKKLIEYAKSQS